MMKSIFLRSYPSPLLVEAKDFHGSSSSKRVVTVACSASSPPPSPSPPSRRSRLDSIPKLNQFRSRSFLERTMKEPPLIERYKKQIKDYCPTLDVDESYRCWEAYFRLKELESEFPKDAEELIREGDGQESLVRSVHSVWRLLKQNKNALESPAPLSVDKERVAEKIKNVVEERVRECPIPDGLPKSPEELAEEESVKMPETWHTRLLRARGKYPAWYTPRPDHETD